MKFLRTACILAIAFITMLLSSCGSDGIQSGIEYVYAAPVGSDTATVNEIARILKARLEAYGLSEGDFEISTKDTNIMVRMAAGEGSLETTIIMQSKGDVTFYETFAYGDIIHGILEADSIYSELMGAPFDSINGRRSTLFPLWVPTAQQAQSMSGTQHSFTGLDAAICYCLVKDTAEFMSVLTCDSTVVCFPRNVGFRWYPIPPVQIDQPMCALLACKTGQSSSFSAGKIVDAKYQGIGGNLYELSCQMDDYETTSFQRFTKNNTGRVIAIDIDGIVWSYPKINSAISNGTAVITGGDPVMFHALEAVMKGGPYPAPVRYKWETAFGL